MLIISKWVLQSTLNKSKDFYHYSYSWVGFFFCLFFFCLFVLLGPHPRHMEDPRLGVKLELQLPAQATTTATHSPKHVCNLHHSSLQRQIPDPLRKPRDWTCVLMGTSWVSYCWATMGTVFNSHNTVCTHIMI